MQCDPKMLNRLRRAEGQIRGILRMMDKHAECKDVTTQLLAVRSSIDKVLALIAVQNLKDQVTQKTASQIMEDPEIQAALKLSLIHI